MLRGYRVASGVCRVGLMTAATLVWMVSTASAKPTVYVLSDGKVMSFDAAPALEKSKSWIKKQAELDKEEAKEKAKAEAEGKIHEYKPRPKLKLKDPGKVISEGWKDAYDIATDGKHIYVLSKTSVGRFAIANPGKKEKVSDKVPERVRQMQADKGYVYLATPSEIYRLKGDGSEEPQQITKGWGGMRDFVVKKGTVYLRMGSGEFYALRGKKWKEKLVGKGWKGILQMRMDSKTKKIYLFSGGQVFLFRPGGTGSQAIDGLTSDLEVMAIWKGKFYFSARAGKIVAVEKAKGKWADQYPVRRKASLVDDMLVL